jgi:hypothetical protein
MSMIPQMTNLVSLSLEEQWSYGALNEDFLSTFRTCLRQSAIEELCLSKFYRFPFSILDDAQNLNKLTLSECTATSEDEPVQASGSRHRSLETLVIVRGFNPGILLWAKNRATDLKTLELRGLPRYDAKFAGLLQACSNSLTSFLLDINNQCTQYPSLFPLEFT